MLSLDETHFHSSFHAQNLRVCGKKLNLSSFSETSAFSLKLRFFSNFYILAQYFYSQNATRRKYFFIASIKAQKSGNIYLKYWLDEISSEVFEVTLIFCSRNKLVCDKFAFLDYKLKQKVCCDRAKVSILFGVPAKLQKVLIGDLC